MDYEFLDSGNGQKLERFGPYRLVRPAPAALWHPRLPLHVWEEADGFFARKGSKGWTFRKPLPPEWELNVEGLRLRLKCTDFGHLGFFPEHSLFWPWIEKGIQRQVKGKQARVLNLFAYSGGATLAASRAGAHVCHVDAAQGMVQWARANATLCGLKEAPIRWIVEDAEKFVRRCLRRGERYEGIILDPPTFGRGPQGEVFKIEERLVELLKLCHELLSEQPLFFLLTTHTPGLTVEGLKELFRGFLPVEVGEILFSGKEGGLPSGHFAQWAAS